MKPVGQELTHLLICRYLLFDVSSHVIQLVGDPSHERQEEEHFSHLAVLLLAKNPNPQPVVHVVPSR